MQVESLLFSTSLLQEGHHDGGLEEARDNSSSNTILPAAKKKRKERQFVMFTDPHTGLRCRLYPTMSLAMVRTTTTKYVIVILTTCHTVLV